MLLCLFLVWLMMVAELIYLKFEDDETMHGILPYIIGYFITFSVFGLLWGWAIGIKIVEFAGPTQKTFFSRLLFSSLCFFIMILLFIPNLENNALPEIINNCSNIYHYTSLNVTFWLAVVTLLGYYMVWVSAFKNTRYWHRQFSLPIKINGSWSAYRDWLKHWREKGGRCVADRELDALKPIINSMSNPYQLPRLLLWVKIFIVGSIIIYLLSITVNLIFLLFANRNPFGLPCQPQIIFHRIDIYYCLFFIVLGIAPLLLLSWVIERKGCRYLSKLLLLWATLTLLWLIPVMGFALDPKVREMPSLLFILVFPFIIVSIVNITQVKLTPWKLLIADGVIEKIPRDNNHAIGLQRPRITMRFGGILGIILLLNTGCVALVDWPEEPYCYGYTPTGALSSDVLDNGTYSVTVIVMMPLTPTTLITYHLIDENGKQRYSGDVGIQFRSGSAVGIDVGWPQRNPNGSHDLAARAYDVEHETDTCNADKETGCLFPVAFFDNDFNSKISPGDKFIIRGSQYDSQYEINDNWKFRIKFRPHDRIIGYDTKLK